MRGLRCALYPRSLFKVQLRARSGLAWDKARLGAVRGGRVRRSPRLRAATSRETRAGQDFIKPNNQK